MSLRFVVRIFERVQKPYGYYPSWDTVGYAADIDGPAENFFDGWDFSVWHREE